MMSLVLIGGRPQYGEVNKWKKRGGRREKQTNFCESRTVSYQQTPLFLTPHGAHDQMCAVYTVRPHPIYFHICEASINPSFNTTWLPCKQ